MEPADVAAPQQVRAPDNAKAFQLESSIENADAWKE